MKKKTRIVRAFALCAPIAIAQTQTKAADSIVVKAARLLDVRRGSYIENAGIWVEGERIKAVGRFNDVVARAPQEAKIIDLRPRHLTARPHRLPHPHHGKV